MLGLNPSAFEPFYDEPVAFHGRRPGARPVDLTVNCCAFEGGFDDPTLDVDADTDRRVVGLSFPRTSWRDTTPPQVGEIVTYDADTFRVFKVERVVDDYHVTVREGTEP